MISAVPPPTPPWTWPLESTQVVTWFQAPEHRYGPGHRGLDLAASPGQPVRAVAAGRVTFVGQVAGVPMVTIDHGAIRSTYQPVRSDREVGTFVEAGDPLGLVDEHGDHCPTACLHLGARRGDDYADPLRLLTARRAVLKPLRPVVPRREGAPG